MIVANITKENDEWYTPEYAVKPILEFVPKGSRVWCPFDKDGSKFVKLLKEHGCEVINTHKDTGNDFFETEVECDYIISNPPYSLKYAIYERLFSLGKPWAMLVGTIGLFDNQKRFEMFRDNHFEWLVFNKRIKFELADGGGITKNPPFATYYLCHNMLPDRFVFRKLERE